MTSPLQHILLSFTINLRRAAALAIGFALATSIAPWARSQTFQVIHDFTGGADGAAPKAGLTMDGAGSLYGTASSGGIANDGYGTVYRLKRSGSDWVCNPLYSFLETDGTSPRARVVFGPDGVLYGTTSTGGDGSNCFGSCGTVFNLRPSLSACRSALCPWTDTVIYKFTVDPDGDRPGYGDVLFDRAGNIYGTTVYGGMGQCYGLSCGVVYELTPSRSGWTESVLYSFSGASDGALPYNGVISDKAGNLYGTTAGGGTSNCGVVFQLTYSAGSGWTEYVLHSFQCGNDGSFPYAGLIFDSLGNLYGATTSGGTGNSGTVFELTPSGNTWAYHLLYSFTGGGSFCGPWGTLAVDAAGNIYGTTYCGGEFESGSVFKLTQTGGGWTYASLYDFDGGGDGGYPISNVAFNTAGNLYGTANEGGTYACGGLGCGVVWEITP